VFWSAAATVQDGDFLAVDMLLKIEQMFEMSQKGGQNYPEKVVNLFAKYPKKVLKPTKKFTKFDQAHVLKSFFDITSFEHILPQTKSVLICRSYAFNIDKDSTIEFTIVYTE
jgi:hypothetical protein